MTIDEFTEKHERLTKIISLNAGHDEKAMRKAKGDLHRLNSEHGELSKMYFDRVFNKMLEACQ